MRHRMETIAAHAGGANRSPGQPVAPPIALSTTFFLSEPGAHEGYGYGRLGNPSRDGLEHTLADLEGGVAAAAFASGCAAMHAVLQLLGPGDHLVACSDIYGGTYRLIERIIQPTGVEVSWVDMSEPAAVARAFRPETKLVWIETPTNPLLRVFDIAEIADLAKARGAWCAVDGTFTTPLLQRPLELGADMVVHSMSKYLNGHSDVIAGAVVSGSPELAERIRFTQQAAGAVISPFDSYLTARGIKTLPLRMERHCDNALALAQWLQRHPRVKAVHYPGLPSHASHGLASRQMRGFGGILSFEVEGGMQGAAQVLRAVELFALAESLGGAESLIGQPATMSHATMPASVRAERGIRDGLIRVSVGLEHVDDLQNDLEQALSAS